MNMRCLIIYLASSYFLFLGNQIVSAQTLDQTIVIGDSLSELNQFENALYFYQRARFFSKGQQRHELATKIARTYQQINNYPKAIEFYDYAVNSAFSDSLRWEMQFEKMALCMQHHNFKDAYVEILSLPNEMPAGIWSKRKNFYAGTIYLGMSDLENAKASFLLLLPAADSSGRELINSLFRDIKHKNVRLARTLSYCLPGSGQIYAGDYKAGINSFVLTGIIATMGVVSGINYGWSGSLWTTNWFLRYYQGGVREAEISARRKNMQYRERLYHQLIPIVTKTH